MFPRALRKNLTPEWSGLCDTNHEEETNISRLTNIYQPPHLPGTSSRVRRAQPSHGQRSESLSQREAGGACRRGPGRRRGLHGRIRTHRLWRGFSEDSVFIPLRPCPPACPFELAQRTPVLLNLAVVRAGSAAPCNISCNPDRYLYEARRGVVHPQVTSCTPSRMAFSPWGTSAAVARPTAYVLWVAVYCFLRERSLPVVPCG